MSPASSAKSAKRRVINLFQHLLSGKAIIEAIGAVPSEVYLGRDLLCVFEDEETIKNLEPDMEKLLKLDGLLVQVTAPGKKEDSVSRTFAPKLNVTEDPVCGSGHCHIVPYLAKRLGKNMIGL